MGKFIDHSGQVFGRLTVISRAENRGKNVMYNCNCDCGNKATVWVESLKNGSTRSCGCLRREVVTAKNTKHGQRYTRLYRIWLGMKSRCYIKSQSGYKYYGAKGVTICAEWLNDFDAFRLWAKSNGYKDNLSIDRINPFGNYEPENCKWSTTLEQEHNKRNRAEAIKASARSRMKKVRCVETGAVYESLKAAAEDVGVGSSKICTSCRNPNRTAAGFHFEYYGGGVHNDCV